MGYFAEYLNMSSLVYLDRTPASGADDPGKFRKEAFSKNFDEV